MRRILISFVAIFLFIGVSCSNDMPDEKPPTEEPTEESSTNDADEIDPSDTEDEESIQSDEKNQEDSSKETNTSSDTSDLTDDLKVHYIDAGQADATLFQYTYNDKPYTVLFDAGDWNRKDVVSYLHNEEITSIDLIIISHPHADHIGQLAQIMNEFTVDEVWFSGNTASSGTYQKAAESVLESDADYYEPRAGETFEIGSLGIEVLHPNTLTGGLNEDSLSVRMTYGNVALIFTGDAYKNEELQMIEQADHINAQILQLGHHGSRTSTDKNFIDAVQPDIAIYSAGVGNSYGHPHQETIDLINQADIDLYGTDVHGTIIVTTDGKTYELTTESTGTVNAGSASKDESKPKKEQPNDQKQDEQKSSSSSCIDINKASPDELQQIKHIGPARAEDVIDLRPFESVDDLSKVNGIGPARIADIIEEGKACVGGA